MTRNLTRGNPMRLILSFGIPILFGYLFQQLYNVVDTAIVGKTLGGAALAAVGSTGSVNFLVVGFCAGVCGGFAILAAQQFGAGDEKELRRYVTGGAWLTILFGAALTAATLLLGGPILTIMNTPADIYDRAYIYIMTIFAGLPGYFLYNYAAGVLRALGDSRTPVIWLIAASLLNIVLDFVFILTFHMDVFGAAFATILSGHCRGGVPGADVPGLPGAENGERGLALGLAAGPGAVCHGPAHGAAVLHHRHRLHRAPSCGQRPGQHLCGGGGGGKQAVSAALLPL